MSKRPSKIEQYLANAGELRHAVNAYRARKAQQPAAEPPQSTKPERRWQPPAERPTELPGFPLNDSPPQEIPDYRTMQTAQIAARARATQARLRGIRAPMNPIGPPELRKSGR